jgi:hypothetical protein
MSKSSYIFDTGPLSLFLMYKYFKQTYSDYIKRISNEFSSCGIKISPTKALLFFESIDTIITTPYILQEVDYEVTKTIDNHKINTGYSDDIANIISTKTFIETDDRVSRTLNFCETSIELTDRLAYKLFKNFGVADLSLYFAAKKHPNFIALTIDIPLEKLLSKNDVNCKNLKDDYWIDV